jgi:hypothetical protein
MKNVSPLAIKPVHDRWLIMVAILTPTNLRGNLPNLVALPSNYIWVALHSLEHLWVGIGFTNGSSPTFALEICNNIICKCPFRSNMDDITRRETLLWVKKMKKELVKQMNAIAKLDQNLSDLEGMLLE